jgi:XTP/dITP diphosphohydrolase
LTAFFICSLCLYDPIINVATNFIGRIDGNISFEAKGNNGFGYDPIFQADGHEKTFAELSPLEKANCSHRGLAVQQLIKFLTAH